MSAKKKVYVRFEGIIVPSVSGEGLAETDKAWLVEIAIPEKYSGEEIWIAKSMVKNDIKIRNGDSIQGSVESWIFKKLDKKDIDLDLAHSAQSEVKIIKKVEVIQPNKEEMKAEYTEFVGVTPKKGMQFKEVSFSLGEKVSVNFQSKNAQLGTVISVGGVSPELAYQSAVNFVKARLKEEVKKIREEML